MTKKEMRAAVRRDVAALAPDERRRASRAIFEAVERLPLFDRAACVALYASLPDEPDTHDVLVSWSARKRVVVPRVEGDGMRFCDYDPATMAPGAFGVAEPGAEARLCPPSEIDLVVVPGVAFDASLVRLGRGKGFYDRYLSQPSFRGGKVGVCFACQRVGALPAEPHDVKMDLVIDA